MQLTSFRHESPPSGGTKGGWPSSMQDVQTEHFVQQHFTARAATYQGAGDETLAAMVEFAALAPKTVALDVATGTGAVAFELAPGVGEQGRVIGVDLTMAMLQRAAERRREKRRPRAGAPRAACQRRHHAAAVPGCLFRGRGLPLQRPPLHGSRARPSRDVPASSGPVDGW